MRSTMSATVDRINLSEMRKAASVLHYSRSDELSAAEQAALDRVTAECRGQAILDIGVGGGRTVTPLMRVSSNYLGVDNSPEMIEACKERFPSVRFKLGDARALTDLPDASIKLAMFSCNGIGMVAHQDRLSIMREVHRLLKPGGVFLFSTHNQNCPDHSAGFRLPEFEFTRNPKLLAWRLVDAVRRTPRRFARYMSTRKLAVRTPEYSIINDVCHDYGVMLYYITLENQRRQLVAEGFDANAEAYDLNGELITSDTTLSSIMLIARKA